MTLCLKVRTVTLSTKLSQIKEQGTKFRHTVTSY